MRPRTGRSGRAASRPSTRFFERFRAELKRYAEGVHELGPPAGAAVIARAESRIDRSLPEPFRELLVQWNGALLFHDEVQIFGVSGARPELDRLALVDGETVFGEGPSGPLRFDLRGRVIALDAETEGRTIEGSDFERWLDATMAREGLVYDHEGEFRGDAFAGVELTEKVLRKRAELASRADPEAPAWQGELGRLLAEAKLFRPAADAFERAVELDPEGSAAWFSLGKLRRELADEAAACEAFRRAGETDSEPTEAAFAFAHAARSARAASLTDEGALLAKRVIEAEASFGANQRAAAEHLIAEGDFEGAIERLSLALAVAPDDAELKGVYSLARARRSLRPL